MNEFEQRYFNSPRDYIVLGILTLFLVIVVVIISDSPFEKANKFDNDGFKQSENFIEQEVVTLEIADMTSIRIDSYNLINFSYLLKVKSDNPLYDGKTIAISKEDYYNKYEIGKSYPFTLETQTSITTTLKP